MLRLFLYILPTDIITVSVNLVFCVLLQRQSVGADEDEALNRLKTVTLQALLHIKMNCSDAMVEECVPAAAKAWLSEHKCRLGFGVPVWHVPLIHCRASCNKLNCAMPDVSC